MSEGSLQIYSLIACRVCKIKLGNFFTLNTKIQICEMDVDLLTLFNETMSVRAYLGDSLPQMLCCDCVNKMKNFYKFVELAKQSDRDFRLMRSAVSTEINHTNPGNESHQATESLYDGNQINEELKFEFLHQEDLIMPQTETEEEIAIVQRKDEIIEQYSELEDNLEYEREIIEIKCLEPLTDIVVERTTEPSEMHGRNKHECTICKKRFRTKQHLRQHTLVHTKEKTFLCTICDKRFSTIYRQRDHMRIHTNERDFVCEYCDKQFTTRNRLKVHLITHTGNRPYACQVCGRAFQQNSVLKTHMAIHVGKKAECDVCLRKFSRRSHLNIHKRLHTGNRPYKCPLCDSAYMQKSHLDRHLNVHQGIRFRCDHCSKLYTKKSTLDTHIQQQHLRDKIYYCNMCLKKFDKQKSFYYHMKTKHTEAQDTPSSTNDIEVSEAGTNQALRKIS